MYDFFVSRDLKVTSEHASSSSLSANLRLKQRTQFDYYFALLFILALHGLSALKVLLILFFNYRIAKDLPRKYIPVATWLFNIGILFANELYDGYPLSSIANVIKSTKGSSGQVSSLISFTQWLDGFGGLMPRWQILFKVTILRLISFNMDYYWSLEQLSSSPIEVRIFDSD